jgi:hypothetical protein
MIRHKGRKFRNRVETFLREGQKKKIQTENDIKYEPLFMNNLLGPSLLAKKMSGYPS